MKNKGFLQMQKLAEAGHRVDIARCQWIARQQCLDKVALTLAELGWEPEQIRTFAEKYVEVEREYCEEVLSDPTGDFKCKDADMERKMALAVAKAHIDDALKKILPEDMFCEYDKRYDYFYRPGQG